MENLSREKQKLECEMAEMLEIIEKARESYANDITDHTENEYIREGLLDAGYRKQSEVIEEYRKKVYSKMEKYTVFGREYIQRIMREVEKEMKGGAE